jgi:predicted metal-dependent hydrolase
MENRILKVDGQQYDYKLRRRARAKYLRLSIDYDGTVVVTAAKTYPIYLIQKFMVKRWSWVLQNVDKQKSTPSLLHQQHPEQLIKKYKKITRNLINTRLEFFNQIYNFEYNRIAIRNQKTRWGSCSSDKNLNFNYRLCLLPPFIADYIIVHEMCHLAELNHSRAFWQLVSKAMPNYKNIEAELKKI